MTQIQIRQVFETARELLVQRPAPKERPQAQATDWGGSSLKHRWIVSTLQSSIWLEYKLL
jgi:hypothetical protein